MPSTSTVPATKDIYRSTVSSDDVTQTTSLEKPWSIEALNTLTSSKFCICFMFLESSWLIDCLIEETIGEFDWSKMSTTIFGHWRFPFNWQLRRFSLTTKNMFGGKMALTCINSKEYWWDRNIRKMCHKIGILPWKSYRLAPLHMVCPAAAHLVWSYHLILFYGLL